MMRSSRSAVRLASFSVVGLAMMMSSWREVFPAAESIAGTVSEITMYQGQALVTRTIPIASPPGALEVVVDGLPETVVADSLFAEGGPGIEVRAVRFRSLAVGEEPREEVRKLEEAIEALQQKIELNTKNGEVLKKKVEYLDKLENFVAPAANVEISKGVINAEGLQTVTLFSFKQRDTIAAEQVKLAAEAKDLNKEVSLLQRKRAELATGSSRTVRQAVLFVEKTAPGKETVRLNYLVGNCGWSPMYVFRAAAGGKEVSVEYNALVQQMTGEDWSGVTLTLSTASPALSAAGPGLAPFYVTLSPVAGKAQGQQAGVQGQDIASELRSLKQRQQAAFVSNRNALNFEQNVDSSWGLNDAANGLQRLELVGGEAILSAAGGERASVEDGPSIGYRLAVPVSLASRSDQQMVRILQAALPSHFYHVSTPLLSSHVFREAELTNTSGQDLLGGPLTAYLDGRFVGRAEIPTVTRGQMFVVGFGADPQLKTRRDLLSKASSLQGGNREITAKYLLTVENYKEEPVTMRLFDRLPYSQSTTQIRVTLKDPTAPLSEDKLYQRRERPKGILRWDIEVPAKATGEQSKTVEYGYVFEFDRNLEIAAPAMAAPEAAPAAAKFREEFQELQMDRQKH